MTRVLLAIPVPYAQPHREPAVGMKPLFRAAA
jgi:hypothetical protein